MKKFILDTHIVIWFLTQNKMLDKSIREEIEYMQGEFYITDLSLLEILQLKMLKKIDLNYTLDQLFEKLIAANIGIYFSTGHDYRTLEKLPLLKIDKKIHSDMIDRFIIAKSITLNHTCISHDSKFVNYRKSGLKLIEA